MTPKYNPGSITIRPDDRFNLVTIFLNKLFPSRKGTLVLMITVFCVILSVWLFMITVCENDRIYTTVIPYFIPASLIFFLFGLFSSILGKSLEYRVIFAAALSISIGISLTIAIIVGTTTYCDPPLPLPPIITENTSNFSIYAELYDDRLEAFQSDLKNIYGDQAYCYPMSLPSDYKSYPITELRFLVNEIYQMIARTRNATWVLLETDAPQSVFTFVNTLNLVEPRCRFWISGDYILPIGQASNWQSQLDIISCDAKVCN